MQAHVLPKVYCVLLETAPPLGILPESTLSPDSVTQWLNVSGSSKYKDNELGLRRQMRETSRQDVGCGCGCESARPWKRVVIIHSHTGWQ